LPLSSSISLAMVVLIFVLKRFANSGSETEVLLLSV
jgi:hypothetical protein